MSDLISARDGLRDLMSRYTDAVWRNDYAAFADCFTEDGEWRISGAVLRGRKEIVDSLAAKMGLFKGVLIKFENPLVALQDGVALSRVYLTEHAAMKDGPTVSTIGTYYDRCVLQADRWRFDWRYFELHYMGPVDLSGTFYPAADYGPPPGLPAPGAVPPDHFSQSA